MVLRWIISIVIINIMIIIMIITIVVIIIIVIIIIIIIIMAWRWTTRMTKGGFLKRDDALCFLLRVRSAYSPMFKRSRWRSRRRSKMRAR